MDHQNHKSESVLPLFNGALVCAVFLLWASLAWAGDIVIDDFDNGIRNQNTLGGFTGSFSNGGSGAFCVESLSEGGMALVFSREPVGAPFAGFFSQLGPGAGTIDLTAPGVDVNQLSFKVRGDLVDSTPAGGQNFQIEVKDDSGHTLKTGLTNVPGFETGAVEGALLEVNIPFSAMRPFGDGPIDMSRVREVVIVFNQEFTDPNVSGASRILIEDLKFTHRENPPENLLEPDPANPDIDLIAGTEAFDVHFFVGPSNRHVLTVAEDPKALRGAALKMYHDLSERGDFFNFVAFVPELPIDLVAEGIQTVKFRARKEWFSKLSRAVKFVERF